MTAIEIARKGGPEVLVPRNVARPRLSDRQILIKVAAAGVNGPDVQQREGHYPAPKGHSEIPGLEVAGAVAGAGSSATRFKLGDPVMALVNGGGYAEYCVAPETSCLPVPPRLSLVEAGGVPETFFTVWHNVFERGRLKAGEWLLVHGGAGGTVSPRIQLAKAFGAKVIITDGSKEKCDACLALGADYAINYKTEDFVTAVKEATGGHEQRQAAPLGPAILSDVLAGLGDSDLDRRDSAMLATPYMLALRRSELVEIDFEVRGDGADAGLRVLRMTDHGLELELLRSKASQEKPVTIAVDRQYNPRSFAALERWIEHAQIMPGTALFRRINPALVRGSPGDGVNRAVKAALVRYYVGTGFRRRKPSAWRRASPGSLGESASSSPPRRRAKPTRLSPPPRATSRCK